MPGPAVGGGRALVEDPLRGAARAGGGSRRTRRRRPSASSTGVLERDEVERGGDGVERHPGIVPAARVRSRRRFDADAATATGARASERADDYNPALAARGDGPTCHYNPALAPQRKSWPSRRTEEGAQGPRRRRCRRRRPPRRRRPRPRRRPTKAAGEEGPRRPRRPPRRRRRRRSSRPPGQEGRSRRRRRPGQGRGQEGGTGQEGGARQEGRAGEEGGRGQGRHRSKKPRPQADDRHLPAVGLRGEARASPGCRPRRSSGCRRSLLEERARHVAAGRRARRPRPSSSRPSARAATRSSTRSRARATPSTSSASATSCSRPRPSQIVDEIDRALERIKNKHVRRVPARRPPHHARAPRGLPVRRDLRRLQGACRATPLDARDPRRRRGPGRPLLATAIVLGVVALDQLTKAWAVRELADGPVSIIGDDVELRARPATPAARSACSRRSRRCSPSSPSSWRSSSCARCAAPATRSWSSRSRWCSAARSAT